MSTALAIAAAILFFAAVAIVVRVKREYERDRVLSAPTVAAVWILYVVIVAVAIAAAIDGTWDLGIPVAVALPIGLALVAAGIALETWGVASMASARRMSGMQPDKLITSGAFRFSRNPQNVGLGLVIVGAGIAGSSGLALAIAAAFTLVFRVYLVYEERHLKRVFGDEYLRYEERTPRYLGRASSTSARRAAPRDPG